MTESQPRGCDSEFDDTDYGDISGGGESSGYNGEKQLWCAVIHMAILDLKNTKEDTEHYRRQANKWFRMAGEDFREVCSNAGLNPEWVRNNLMEQGLIYG